MNRQYAFQEIQRPTILVDESRVRRNIEWMAAKAAHGKCGFRPHFKTHQSAHIGNWFRDYAVKAITVSSIEMAAYFSENGWQDITIAFPVNLRQISLINDLANRISLNILVENQAIANILESQLTARVGAWISIDTGYGREGRSFSDIEGTLSLIRTLQAGRHLQFRGLLAHFGNTYNAAGPVEISQIYRSSLSKLLSLKAELEKCGIKDCQISVGDTPGCTLVDDLGPVDEIRPGNFVFYDLTQLQLGVCSVEQIAAVVACPVVGIYPERNTIALQGGAVHLSKDFIAGPNGTRLYGKVAQLTETAWGPLLNETVLYSLSQEHGLIRTTDMNCRQIQVGDLLAVLPAHICLAVSALKHFQTLNNQGFEACAC